MCTHPAPLYAIFFVGPFAKWGIDFTMCNPPSSTSHHYIFMVIDYFTKWVEALPTYSNDAKTATLFLFNHIIARFGVPQSIVTDHGTHFCNTMMIELTTILHLDHERSSPSYPKLTDRSNPSIDLKDYALMDGQEAQIKLAYPTLFSIVGIPNLF